MLLNEKSGESEQAQYEIDAAFWKSEFECPICFEVRVTSLILNMVSTVVMLQCPSVAGDAAAHADLAVCGRAPGVRGLQGQARHQVQLFVIFYCLVTGGML